MSTSYYISERHATYSVTVENDVVTEAAPIAKWLRGKSWSATVFPWLTKRKAHVEELPSIEAEPKAKQG